MTIDGSDDLLRIHALDEEESAQGYDLFRAPGASEMLDQAREENDESHWTFPVSTTTRSPVIEHKEAITRRRQELYDVMRELEARNAVASRAPNWLTGVQESLERLETALTRHIAEVEADDGLFADIVDVAPRLQQAVVDLASEHESLLNACRKALAEAAEEEPDLRRIRRRVNSIVGKVSIHRQRGAELLYEAFMDDVAAAD